MHDDGHRIAEAARRARRMEAKPEERERAGGAPSRLAFDLIELPVVDRAG